MRKSILIALLFSSVLSFAQNYEPSRQTIRLDIGGLIFGDIENKFGPYMNTSYEYAFMDNFAAEATLSASAHHANTYEGYHASRYGIGLNLIGRLYGLKSPYDVKVLAGVRYGSNMSTHIEPDGNGGFTANDGTSRSGFSPVLGLGYEQRLGDWLVTFEFKSSIETNTQTFNSLAIGFGYRF
ncbi:outer membrane beta-barrel protein [Phaeocystidibacter marisrubri]|uniref:Porin family protein n=1 Tax=Phaeocystidibacter marisrubri TaxID=1577780 RepID=A0A6L3ZH40_9FLAO|nr:outer membrane beta-barrel protein [Phaeocystidibacter marisrubri]KAB2817336.1 porin family protein [Phaeocystidibacter marisrubri]GGH75858.1 hypothetical protein GCM10011318_23310 [Phaeocystidibacter marisrubri]